MSGLRRKKAKLPPFVALGRFMLRSKEWRGLSPKAKILYIHLKHKYVGHNNGDIELHYSELKDMMASSTISSAFKELEAKGWITPTKYGGLYRYVNKYKLTGKYDEIIVRLGL